MSLLSSGVKFVWVLKCNKTNDYGGSIAVPGADYIESLCATQYRRHYCNKWTRSSVAGLPSLRKTAVIEPCFLDNVPAAMRRRSSAVETREKGWRSTSAPPKLTSVAINTVQQFSLREEHNVRAASEYKSL